jgi:ABC-type oligopeptide transport system ATPase subunit
LEIERGQTLGLVGVSGSGKSVLGRIILGLVSPTSGDVLFEGQPICHLSRRKFLPYRPLMQMVFQNPLSSTNPRRTAGSIIEMPLRSFGIGDARRRKSRVVELLELVGLSARHSEYYPHEFSGGQCQRLGIARALASNPKFIFLDEPVSALDVSIQAQILNLLNDLQEKLGLTYLFVANNLNVVQHMSTKIAVLHQGRIAEIGEADRLLASPRERITKDLLAAVVALHRSTAGRPHSQL